MLSDVVGRKLVLAIADIVFIGGAVGQAVCHTVWSMVVLSPRWFFASVNNNYPRLAVASSSELVSVWRLA